MRMRSIALLLCFLALSLPVIPYEDLTHQKLTLQAAYIASLNGANGLTGTVDNMDGIKNSPIVQAIIAGAGEGPEGRGTPDERPRDTDGEDYTAYTIEGCPVKVIPKYSKTEPFNHFRLGMLTGMPALIRVEQFHRDVDRLEYTGSHFAK